MFLDFGDNPVGFLVHIGKVLSRFFGAVTDLSYWPEISLIEKFVSLQISTI